MLNPFGYGSKLSTPKIDGFPTKHDQKSVGHWYHNGLSQTHKSPKNRPQTSPRHVGTERREVAGDAQLLRQLLQAGLHGANPEAVGKP